METLVKEKILEQFVKEIPTESATIQPINVDIKSTDVTRMTTISTMKTNDGNYFIRYGGFVTSSSYNAIEVYSVNSLDNNAAIYVFDNLQIDNHTFFIEKMKQSEDGRFYAVAQYYDGTNTTNYLIIFNNFIQDGYCQINKYYTASNIGTNDGFFYDVTKVKDAGVYFILTESHLIRFEINVIEGNKISIATIVDGNGTISGSYQPQLNVLKDKLIFTKLWETEDYAYEYTKTVIDVNEELSSTITLNRILNLPFTQYVAGAKNNPYEAIIPYLSSGNIYFIKIDINGNINRFGDYSRTFNNNNLHAYLADNYASVTDNSNLYIYYVIDEGPVDERLIEFYNGTFSGYYSNTQILKQNNIVNLIGTASVGTQQSIVSIKNIYSPNVTSEPYFEYDFCLPYYMNLYSDANDDTSLIFSRDATARFYSGNQITSTFIVPNYLLNDGNIEKASVYGKTNYLLNSEVEDYQKNKFESLYFNFIYNLNVIDNTNGLNTLNQIGSNKVANGLWKTFDNYDLMLTKARITYEDLSTEIINLNLVSLIGGTAIFNYNVNGNITQIEYLNNDESTVYATYKRKISGSHTITQVVKTIQNDIGTANGTSIYISDSSNLTFANIQINGNSVQNGTPTPSSPALIKSAGDAKNIYYLPEAGTSNGITYTINEDETINLSGTATAAVTFPIFKSIAEAQIENGATYTFSSNQALPSGVEFRAEAFNNSSWLRHLIGSVLDSSHQVFTGTANLTNATRIRHLIYIANGTTVNITNLGIQFEKGNTQSSFTPEGKGFIKETIGNRNLLINEAINQTLNGLTFTVNADKSITVNGTATANTNYTLVGQSGVATEVLKLNANENYYNTTSLRLVYRLVNGDYGAINSGAFTSSNDLSIRHIYLSIPSGTTYNNEKILPQLIKGTIALEYEPHQEQLFTIPCQQPMRSIGNVRDEFIKQDGLWYEKHNIGVIESYNGETITTDFMSTTGSLSTGAFVQYVLNEPNYIDCTQEQIEALESIIRAYTYEPITNINSTDETPAYLNVTYYKQL